MLMVECYSCSVRVRVLALVLEVEFYSYRVIVRMLALEWFEC